MDREVIRHQPGDAGGARRIRHPQHRDQHQDRAEQRVEEELVAGVDAVRAAPDADNQEHRDQAAFEEDVEQEQVLRGEGADHQHFGDEERRHIFGHAPRDRLPARADTDRHQEHGQFDQQQREPVDAERPAEAAEQRHVLDELPLRAAILEMAPQHDAEHEIDQRRAQRQPLGRLARQEQAGDRRDRRNGDHEGEERKAVHRVIAQVTAAVRPISMTKA